MLTTIFEVNGKRLICLHLRTTDQEESLVEGDPIEIGGVFYGVIRRIEKERVEIKIDGELVKRRSELASKTPIGIANSNSFNLVMGPPQQRRAYIDWCLFHVEHQYVDHWTQFRHALKQRNQLLKERKDLNLLEYWDDYLIKPSLAMHQ